MPSYTSVAVIPTKRAGLRKQPSPPIAQSAQDNPALEVAVALFQPRVQGAMHRYRVGDQLTMNSGGRVMKRTASSCRIVALLPYEGRGPLTYRVRSDAEAFERIVAEADLR